MQQLIHGTGTAIWWLTEPRFVVILKDYWLSILKVDR